MSRIARYHNVLLWIAQGLLAAVFLFAGGMKLALPVATLAKLSPLSPGFMKFIGICEVSGGLGLVLPGIFRVARVLTPLAASGLVIIMLGAVILTIATQGTAPAVIPFMVGVIALTIARGRSVRAAAGHAAGTRGHAGSLIQQRA